MAEQPTSSNPEDQPKPSSIIQYKCSKKWTQVHYLKVHKDFYPTLVECCIFQGAHLGLSVFTPPPLPQKQFLLVIVVEKGGDTFIDHENNINPCDKR